MQKTHSLTRIASALISAWRFVDNTGAHAANARTAIGISEQGATVGKAVSCVTNYSCWVEAAEALAEGDLVRPALDGSGRASKGFGGDTCGRALGGAAAGKLVEVRFIEGAAVPGAGFSESYIDYVASGLVLPAAGPLNNNVTSGVAWVTGVRVEFSGQPVVLTASADNYIDALPNGTVTVQPVALAAAAPAVAVNGLRLGFVKTGPAGPTAIVSVTATGKDSLGNWMRNTSRRLLCILGGANTTAITPGATNVMVPFDAASEQYDNASMHNGAANQTRITAPASGWYTSWGSATWSSGGGTIYATVRKNGDVAIPGMTTEIVANGGKTSVNFASAPFYLEAGEYIQLRMQMGNAGVLATANLALRREA